MAEEPEEEGPKLYNIKRSTSGPKVTKLSTSQGAFQMEKGGEGITILLDDFERASIEATGHYEVKASRRKPPVPAIPRRKPEAAPEEEKK